MERHGILWPSQETANILRSTYPVDIKRVLRSHGNLFPNQEPGDCALESATMHTDGYSTFPSVSFNILIKWPTWPFDKLHPGMYAATWYQIRDDPGHQRSRSAQIAIGSKVSEILEMRGNLNMMVHLAGWYRESPCSQQYALLEFREFDGELGEWFYLADMGIFVVSRKSKD